MHAQFTVAASALTAIVAGNATVTLVSRKSGARFTYRIRAAKTGEVHFVSLLTGSDNENDYSYIGILTPNGFRSTAKSRISSETPSVKGFAWAVNTLTKGTMPETLEVWHSGKCCRCNRKLTTPESIARGLGPECWSKSGG